MANYHQLATFWQTLMQISVSQSSFIELVLVW